MLKGNNGAIFQDDGVVVKILDWWYLDHGLRAQYVSPIGAYRIDRPVRMVLMNGDHVEVDTQCYVDGGFSECGERDGCGHPGILRAVILPCIELDSFF